MKNVLGLSFFYHDSAAALLVNGKPVAMVQEERFSRKKNDSAFPEKAINFVLKEAKIKLSDIDAVVFYEKPFLKFDRVFKTLLATFPTHPNVFIQSLKHLFLDKLWVRSLISQKLKIDHRKIFFSEHHLSHAASSFLVSPYEEAAILSVDGVGEWAVTAISEGNKNQIKIIKEIHFPHSLGLLYSTFTAFLGFKVNEGEYKVMGMAPYGKPRYEEKVKKLITVFEDGSYELDLSYFSFHQSLSRTYTDKFIKLFGQPRSLKSKFFTRATGWPSYFGKKPKKQEYKKIAKEQEYYADLAASIQKILEDILIKLAKEAHRVTKKRKLCLAGGVALNCVANKKILDQTPFEEIFIQPAAGDAGGALGAALAFYHCGLKKKRNYVMNQAYYGKRYSIKEIRDFIREIREDNIIIDYIDNEDKLVNFVAQKLTEGKVVGWVQGKFEWGPRALGHRSILADPRREKMKDVVNTKIKFREPYRPFAPSVLAQKAEEFFDFPEAIKHYPARFMLYVVPVKEDKKKIVPAITHVDGTARPQLVFPEESPRYWKLINAFYQKTGVPMILNTSFNLKGEPIVSSPQDAFKTFEKSGLDVLVLEDYVIMK